MGPGLDSPFESPSGTRLAASLERGATLCVSTQRLARVLRQSWAVRQHAKGLRAWRTPDILPFTAWQRRLAFSLAVRRTEQGRSLPVVLEEQQELLTWEQAVAESGLAEGLLQPRQLAASMMDAHALASDWDIPLDDMEGASPDAAAFAAVRGRARARWSALGVAPAASVAWRAVEAVREVPDLPAEIVFLGFDLPASAAFRETVTALRRRGIRVEILGTDHPFGALRFLRYPSFEDELRGAALWCRALLEQGESDIGIVIPHLDAVRGLTERVFAGVLQPSTLPDDDTERRDLFELSLGPHAIEEPLIHSALLLLDLLRNVLPLEQWSRVLHSPFVRGASTGRSTRAMVDAELRRRGMPEASVADVLHAASSIHATGEDTLFAALRSLPSGDGQRLPSGWTETFSATLAGLGWPGDRGLTSREFQARSRFHELLDECSALDGVSEGMSCADALTGLRQLASSRVFQVRSRSAPVQIMGVRETAGLRFAHVRVLGMNDDVWPPVPRPPVFIPLRLQRRAGVPESSPERFLEQVRTQTSLLLRLAPEVIASCAAVDGERELLPTPLLGTDPPEDRAPVAGDAITVIGGHARERIETARDDMAPPVAAPEQIRGGTRVLALQSSCPFRAFAELRLHAGRPETVERGIRALDRGTLAHAALAGFWKRVVSFETLRALDGTGTRSLVEECVDEALEKDRSIRERRIDGHLVEAERECLVLLLVEWLDVERSRGPFEVASREEQVDISLAGLPLRLFADRIDRLDGGAVALLDYKTGKKSIDDWMSDRPAEPQIPLYVQAMGEQVRAAGFALLRRGACALVGLRDDAVTAGGFLPAGEWLAKRAADVADWDGLRRRWDAVLRRLAEDFMTGRAAVDPRDGDSCRWCELATLCRVQDAGGAVKDAAVDVEDAAVDVEDSAVRGDSDVLE